MDAEKLMRYLDDQRSAIGALIQQLDEVQVAFNAQFDQFKARHDARLEALTGIVYDRLAQNGTEETGAVPPALKAAIDKRLSDEYQRIEERRGKLREEYLPARQQAATDLLREAQGQLAGMRALNPELDAREEELKREKGALEARLAELNDEIRAKSRGLGVVRHFLTLTQLDRERQRVLGKLEAITESLYQVRREWEAKRVQVAEDQARYEQRWQLESIAVARLQSELDQLEDEARWQELALRRAIGHVLDEIKEPLPDSDRKLDAGLGEMVELNTQTDAYHEGLASVGGFIGLLRGIDSGLQAITQSIEGIHHEQRMHSDHLSPLSFSLSDRVQAFHRQWTNLAQKFADERVIGQHPADFSAAVQPLLDGPLSQTSIEAMFKSLGTSIQRATDRWG